MARGERPSGEAVGCLVEGERGRGPSLGLGEASEARWGQIGREDPGGIQEARELPARQTAAGKTGRAPGRV